MSCLWKPKYCDTFAEMVVTKKCIEVMQVTMIMIGEKWMSTTVTGRMLSVIKRWYMNKDYRPTILSKLCSWNSEHRDKFSAMVVTAKRIDASHVAMIMNRKKYDNYDTSDKAKYHQQAVTEK